MSIYRVTFGLSIFLFTLNLFSLRATAASYILFFFLVLQNRTALTNLTIRTKHAYAFFLVNAFVLLISVRHDIYLNFYIKFVLMAFYIWGLLILWNAKLLRIETIIDGIKVSVVLHASFFIFQLIYFQISGVFIDFNNYVREVSAESLYMTRALSDSGISIRATGLYSEPSFYGMAVLPPVFVLMLYEKRLSLPAVLGFGTAIASLSIASIGVALLGLVIYLFKVKGQYGRKVVLFLVLAFYLPSLYIVYDKRVVESID